MDQLRKQLSIATRSNINKNVQKLLYSSLAKQIDELAYLDNFYQIAEEDFFTIMKMADLKPETSHVILKNIIKNHFETNDFITVDWKKLCLTETEKKDKIEKELASFKKETDLQKTISGYLIDAALTPKMDEEEAFAKHVDKKQTKSIRKVLYDDEEDSKNYVAILLEMVIRANDYSALKTFADLSSIKIVQKLFERLLYSDSLGRSKIPEIVYAILIERGIDINGNENPVPNITLASESDNYNVVRLFVASGADSNNFIKALHSAIIKKKVENIEYLLTLIKDVDEPVNKRTALFLAVLSNNEEILRMVIEHGANLSQKFNNGYTALELAILRNYTKMIRILLKAGASTSNIDIMEHYHKGNNELVMLLIQYGKCNKISDLLLEAYQASSNDIVNAIITNLREIDEGINGKSGVLKILIKEQNTSLIDKLLNHEIDLSVVWENNLTPLSYAATVSADVTRHLLMGGADPSSAYEGTFDDKNHEALKTIILYDLDNYNTIFLPRKSSVTKKVLQELFETGISVNKIDSEGNTFLHVAVTTDDPTLIPFLIEAGCDPKKQNKKGKTALMIAEDLKKNEMIKTLRET